MYLFWNHNANKIHICRKKTCHTLIRFSLDKLISLSILMMSRAHFLCYIPWREFLCLFYQMDFLGVTALLWTSWTGTKGNRRTRWAPPRKSAWRCTLTAASGTTSHASRSADTSARKLLVCITQWKNCSYILHTENCSYVLHKERTACRYRTKRYITSCMCRKKKECSYGIRKNLH